MKYSILTILLILVFILSSCRKRKKSNDAADKMQDFVIDLSAYCKGINGDFIIVPQNGIELNFNNVDPGSGVHLYYVNAIEGQGVEELFYNGELAVDQERLNMLQKLPVEIAVMVADHVSSDQDIPDAFQRSFDEGFLAFPRIKNNYDYLEIPDSVFMVNADDIFSLGDARNYLYLISTDAFLTKADMLNAISTTNFDVVLIDLFFDEVALSKADLTALKTKANGAQRLVIAYVNIGAAESYRYYWQADWKKGNPKWLKKKYEGYEDEIWVEFWDPEWQNIIYGNNSSYMKMVLDAGFDGVYLDNVEVYYFLYYK